jgi:signal peptidase II
LSPKLRIVLVLVAVLVPLDQATKWWIANNVSPLDPIEVIPGFFRLTHARNPGAALGLFQDVPIAVFIGLAVVALGLIWSFYRQVESDDRMSAAALGLIIAGACGNLIDRVVHHAVIDFLQFDLGLFIFPDFNVADSAIVIGVGLLLIDLLIAEAQESAAEPPGSAG